MTERKRLAILRTLRDVAKPLNSSRIADELLAGGHDISERTVRFYLKMMDDEGLTRNCGRKGRVITDVGMDRLSSSRVMEKVGFLSAKIDQMAYRMKFDLARAEGTVVLNMTVLHPQQLSRSLDLILRIFEKGLGMGRLLALFAPAERVGDVSVPDGMVGVGTVCSITLNGVLLGHGIPTESRFGGLLEIVDGEPTRFVEAIMYDGTSLDPLEVFARSGMTDFRGVVERGRGRIGASFREFPSLSIERVNEIAERMEKIGLGGLLKTGWPGQPLLDIPVHEGRVGAIIIGGLNPMAAIEEGGERVHSRALSGIVDYRRLFPYDQLAERLRDIL
jgi:repressor of nif and glnA expression